jgi:hypothetical protein
MIFYYSGAVNQNRFNILPERLLRKNNNAGFMLTFSELQEKGGRSDTKKRYKLFKEQRNKTNEKNQ